MGGDPFACATCGGQLRNNPLEYGLMCLSCDTRVLYGRTHAVDGQDPGVAAGSVPGLDPVAQDMRCGGSDHGVQAATRPPGGIELDMVTLQLLAKIIGDEYDGVEITRLLRDAGLDTVGYGGGTEWKFLYEELGRLQDKLGHYGVLEFLKNACRSPGRNKGADVRDDVNACLAFYGLGIGDDSPITSPTGAQGRADSGAREAISSEGQDLQDDDGAAFDRRGYHELVIEHARTKFVKGEYFSSVAESCKVLEELVGERSGIKDDGVGLMGRALGSKGALVVSLPGLKDETRDNVQRGIMSLCVGIVSCVRNPVSHELDLRYGMERTDALDILGTISYLCRQVERTSVREDTKGAPLGSHERSTENPARKSRGSRKASRSRHGGGGSGGAGGFITSLSVSPENVVQGDDASIMVAGRGIDRWYVGVLSEEGKVKSSPTRLGAYGAAARGGDDVAMYAFPVNTLNYDPGEYRVSVSSVKSMDSEGMRIKKFMVHTYEDMLDAIEDHPRSA